MARRAQSSTSVSADASTGDRDGSTVRSYSGQGRTVNNLLFLAACLLIMLGSFWAFASYPDSPVVWIVGLGLYTLALLIPVGLLSNSTTKHTVGGRAVQMDVPPTTEVAGDAPKAAEFGQYARNIDERDAKTHAEHRDDPFARKNH